MLKLSVSCGKDQLVEDILGPRCPHCRAPLQLRSIISIARDDAVPRCRTRYEQRCSAHCALGDTWVQHAV